MVEDSINSEHEPPVKRRSRLFGGRRAARKAAESVAPAVVAADSDAPVGALRVDDSGSSAVANSAATLTPSAERQTGAATQGGAADAVAPAGAPRSSAASAPADVKVPVSDFHDSNPPEDEATEQTGFVAEPREPWLDPDISQTPSLTDAPAQTAAPRTTTSLLFQAPDIQPLPPRVRDFDDYDDRDDDDRDDRGNRAADTVRRRTRRRSGEEGRVSDDLPPNTVVKVRQPRQAPAPELITEPQRVKGSTRLEAKKQRRRDGRDAGRRRPVITEAEFLARREAVDRAMIVRSSHDRIQIGVLEDGVLVEHYVAKAAEASLIGNVYLGRVQNVLPSMEAAFVDIGRGRNAVLYSGEVDWEAADTGNQPRRIELALKPGDTVLVQVTKDPVGHKGARLTSQISLPGRYLVYVPNGNMNGISRKLPDTERTRLKKILKEVLPENQGVIVRTAAEGATEEQLTLDVNRLISQWGAISENVKALQAPALLHGEPDLLIKIIRDVFNEDFHRLVISGEDAQATIEGYLAQVAPDLVDRVEVYAGEKDIFDDFRISEQIEKALDRKVWLPSGGSLVIDRTEAMTVVDVNTGKFVGSGGNLEETVTKNNLEAADEVVRQMRLRDIGGIIVVDFIDMVLESNRDLVLRRLVECLSRDRTKHQVAEVTSLGLVQMTRKKLGLGLLESFSEPCEVCAGRGVVIHHDSGSKHRTQVQTPQPDRRSRGKGGPQGGGSSNGGGSASGSNGSGNGNGGNSSHTNGSHSNGVTHSITPAAQNALAQIAASTIAAANGHKPAASTAAGSVANGDASATGGAEAQAASNTAPSNSVASNTAPSNTAPSNTAASNAAPSNTAPEVSVSTSAGTSPAGQPDSQGASGAGQNPDQPSSGRSRRNSRRSRGQRAAANAAAEAASADTLSAEASAEQPPAPVAAAGTAPATRSAAEGAQTQAGPTQAEVAATPAEWSAAESTATGSTTTESTAAESSLVEGSDAPMAPAMASAVAPAATARGDSASIAGTGSTPGQAAAESVDGAPEMQVEVPHVDLPILDLPVAPQTPPRQKPVDADKLLDSVLEHLPEPKQPGHGRSRSRRVSTAALSAPVTPPPTTSTD